MTPHISVVVPVFGCASCLDELCERLQRTLRTLTDSYEIVLVDDWGPDQAWAVIVALAAASPQIRGIRLSRNFGQHAAIAAGLTVSRGDWLVVLDCDLQDPPEAIAALYEQAQKGADIVFAHRRQRTEGWTRQAISRIYFRLLKALGDISVNGSEGALTIFSRRVAEAYLAMADQDRHHVMLLRWLGFRQASIQYDQSPRKSGRSSYGLAALIDSALNGLFFTSTKLLRVIVYSGIVCAMLGVLIAVALVVLSFLIDTAPGWTSIIVVQFIVGGGIIVCVGTVGLYVGRVFDQVRRRPVFILDGDTNDARS